MNVFLGVYFLALYCGSKVVPPAKQASTWNLKIEQLFEGLTSKHTKRNATNFKISHKQ